MGWSALSEVVASFFVRLPLTKMIFLVGTSAISRELGEHDSLPVLSGLELDGVITSGFTFSPTSKTSFDTNLTPRSLCTPYALLLRSACWHVLCSQIASRSISCDAEALLWLNSFLRTAILPPKSAGTVHH